VHPTDLCARTPRLRAPEGVSAIVCGVSSKVGPGAREAVFAQLSDAGRAEQVAQRLTDGIVLGVLAAGERLPSEPELSRRYGVALITVREALGILRDAGLVQTRRGRDGGSFVVADDAEHRGQLAARLHALTQLELGDLAVYFEAIAGAAAGRAAARATADEAARLRAWLDAADFGTTASARVDQGGFFLELAVLSQSPRLVREQIRLQADAGPVLLVGLGDAECRAAALTEDRRIADALHRRSPQAARAAVGSLIELLTRHLLTAKAAVERGEREGMPDASLSA